MHVASQTSNYDHLTRERIDVLIDVGYCGYTIDNILEKPETGRVIIDASNSKRDHLRTKGISKTNALKEMIDLIDLTIRDY